MDECKGKLHTQCEHLLATNLAFTTKVSASAWILRGSERGDTGARKPIMVTLQKEIYKWVK